MHDLCETTLILDLCEYWFFLHVWPRPDEREPVLEIQTSATCGGASTTWIVFSVKTPSPLKSSTPKHHRYKKDKKSKMILNRIGRRQILLFLLASLSALLTLKNRDKASGSMRVRPPAASTKGWTCNLFLQQTEKISWCGKTAAENCQKEKGQKLLNWPVHEDNLRITFTIFELVKGMFW